MSRLKPYFTDSQHDEPAMQIGAKPMNREFVKFLTRDYQRIFAYVVTFTPNRQDAEDLMQETVLQAWNKFDQFDQSRSFYQWAIGFARNVIRQYHRYRKPAHLALDAELMSQLAVARLAVDEVLELRREAMQICLSQLPDQQRQLLKDCYFDHESIPAASKTLGRSVTALYKAVHRVREKLMDCIERRLKKLEQQEGGSDATS